jgi:hypothetical protein
MSNVRNATKKGGLLMAIAALIVSTSTVAGAGERSVAGEAKASESRLVVVMIDIPFMGFGSRRLVRLPVVFPVPIL